MTVYTPTNHSIFNELDDFGLLLGLPRLAQENNRAYKQRLFDVFVHRSNSSYQGLINGITRELGLEIYHAMTITPVWNGSVIKGDNPAVLFDETKCYVYSDYTETSGLIATLDRYEKSGGAWNYRELIESINSTGYLYAALQSGVSEDTQAMCIFDQKSIDLVIAEDLAKGGVVINLDHQNLLSDSVSISSFNLNERVETEVELVKSGQYYIDYDMGIIYTVEVPEQGSSIRYEYRQDNFEVMASPVIIHNLQSSDFKKKMFEQILLSDGTYTNGAVTALGADLVSELMSIFGLTYDT